MLQQKIKIKNRIKGETSKAFNLSALFIFIFLFSFNLIHADPPFAQPQNLLGGYEIKIPPFDTFKQNEDLNLNFHLFNLSNGVPIDNSSTDCFIHLYQSNGIQELEIEVPHESFNTINNEWEILILGDNFSGIGNYAYIVQCNSSSLGGFESISFSITPSGNSGTANIVFFIAVIVLLFGLNLFGINEKNVYMTMLSGMSLIFLGIYMINNGIIIFRDSLTNYIAYITIAWGFISSIGAILEES
jgi:uncharacterized membrane-anchored protein YitT (DUF2179 family)